MEKEKLLKLLKEVLVKDERVIFAYIYGSFVKEQFFRDIDIRIYIKDSEENPLVISPDIKTQLSRAVKRENKDFTADQFDVQIINQAPIYLPQTGFQGGDIAC
jgi:predicted nucleotidyltransferase